jgi:hypothetical protein
VPRASSALNTIQRVAGAIGTAVFAIVLQRSLEATLPEATGGIQDVSDLAQRQHAEVAPTLADAFGSTFWIAVALTGAALVPALLLPKRQPQERANA